MASKRVAAELLKDVSQRQLADSADPARRQLEAIAAIEDVAVLFERRFETRDAFKIRHRVFAEQLFQQFPIDLIRPHAGELPFQPAQLLQPVESLLGLFEIERRLAAEEVSLSANRVLEPADLVQPGAKLL